ncbi:MAG: acyltransferase, partial [Desulfobulbaceae bacterium]
MPVTPASTTAHHYRPDIDGLRAIAVVIVLIFHAFPENMPGGFVGVDVFFVISGYLISGLIFADLQKGSFRFSDFYARRIRRIFPALILVLAASSLLGWFLLLPDEFAQLGRHVAGGAGFVSNFVLLGEAGYFDSEAELKPLLHLWSLGIEEQFYFIWPLLLFVAWKKRWAPLTLILLLLTGSFAFNIDRVHDHPTSTYFLPFTRFWELMIGCTLAYA